MSDETVQSLQNQQAQSTPIQVPEHVLQAVQSWWNCDDKAVQMVKDNMTLSLCLSAVKVAFEAAERGGR